MPLWQKCESICITRVGKNRWHVSTKWRGDPAGPAANPATPLYWPDRRPGWGWGTRLVLCVGHGDRGMVGGGSERCAAVNLENAFKPSLPHILLFRCTLVFGLWWATGSHLFIHSLSQSIILSPDGLGKLLTTPVAKVNSEPQQAFWWHFDPCTCFHFSRQFSPHSLA